MNLRIAALSASGVALLAVLGAVPGGTPSDTVPAAQAHAHHPAGETVALAMTGSIDGQVAVREKPRRRRARRYAGGRTQPSRTVQALPMVAYLQGQVSGGAAPTAPEMAQQDTAFVPGVLHVPVGTEVEFPNHDSFFHNVFSYSDAKRFDLGRYPQGQSKSVTFDEAGVVKIYCEVHEFMRSAIIVGENRHHAVVGEDGTFSLTGVPAGTYTLVVWHPDLDAVETEVTVADGRATTVELTVQ